MNRSIRNVALGILASAALLSSLPIANAQQTVQEPAVKQEPSRAQTTRREGAVVDQDTARAAHPVTQGGTTGGVVNPGVSGDGQQHGYDGGSSRGWRLTRIGGSNEGARHPTAQRGVIFRKQTGLGDLGPS